MPYRHESVEGKTKIIAEAATLPAAFSDAAMAVWAVALDPDSVKGTETRTRIVVEGANHSELLGAWLKAVLEHSEIDGLLFGEFRVSSVQEVSPTQYLLTGEAWGEPMDAARHQLKHNPKQLVISDVECLELEDKVVCRALVS